MFKKTTFIILLSVLLTGCGGKTPSIQLESDEVANLTTQTENTPTIPESSTVIEDSATTEDSTVTEDSTTTEDSTVTEDSTTTEDSTVTEDSTSKKEPTITETPSSSGDKTTTDKNNTNSNDATVKNTEQVLAEKIVSQIITKNMNEFDKVKAINDYIMLNVRYDRENYEKNTIPFSCYTAQGAMEDGVAVCSGYAKMFQFLAKAAGLDSTYVTGSAGGPHAWNQVKVDGKWYNIDTTWNDPDCERFENGHYYCGCYEYFLISNELFEKTHTPNGKVHECTDNLDLKAITTGCPYSTSSVYCNTSDELKAHVKEAIRTNQLSFHFIANDYKTYKDVVSEALTECNIFASSYKLKKNSYTIYRESKNLVFINLTIETNASCVEDLIITPITSLDEAKAYLETGFKNADQYSWDTQNFFALYVNDKLASDKYFLAQLNTWAFYEHGICIDFYLDWTKVTDNVNFRKLKFTPSTSSTLMELAYSVDELEDIIKRMKDHNVSSISIQLYENNHLLEGTTYSQKCYNFKEKYLKDLISKYCLIVEVSGELDCNGQSFFIEIQSLGHDIEYVDWLETIAPTCATEGLKVKHCRICGEIAETQAIATNDSHTHYWDGDSNTRTLKCKACSYVGISEICLNGVWGYYDDAKAQEYVQRINRQRENIWTTVSDEWGNCIAVVSPPQLIIDTKLNELAATRVIELIVNDFTSTIKDEGYYCSRYYANNKYVRGYAGGVDFYDIDYSRVGVSCFCVDRDDSGFNFLPQYAFEFAN